MLLQLPSSTSSSSNSDWPTFIASVRAAVSTTTSYEGQGQWYCPARRRHLPWINVDELDKLCFSAASPAPVAAAAAVAGSVAVMCMKSDAEAVRSEGDDRKGGIDTVIIVPEPQSLSLPVQHSQAIGTETMPTHLVNIDKQHNVSNAELALQLAQERQQSSLQQADELSRLEIQLIERHRVIVEDIREQARQDVADRSTRESEMKISLDTAIQRVSLLEQQAIQHETEMLSLRGKLEDVINEHIAELGIQPLSLSLFLI